MSDTPESPRSLQPPRSLPLPEPGDQAWVEAQEHERLRQREEETRDLQAVMASPTGRRVLWRLLGLTRLYQSQSLDPAVREREEGARNIGLQILAMLEQLGPKAYATLQLEMIDDRERSAQAARGRMAHAVEVAQRRGNRAGMEPSP